MNMDVRPHAALDRACRLRKARKIKRRLQLDGAGPLRILEVGAGAGYIAHFGCESATRHRVDAVDVNDQRQVSDGHGFHAMAGTAPPFPDGFEVVISNHVIGHVADAPAQRHHLRELPRQMADAESAIWRGRVAGK